MFGLDRGTYEGFMTFADNRDLRRQMYEAYRARGAQGDDQDNRDVLVETAKLRAELVQVAAVAVCWVEAIDRQLADEDDAQ